MEEYGSQQPVSDKFVNELGQVLCPGDPVIVVTTGFNRTVHVRVGTYLGTKNNRVQCVVAYEQFCRVKEGTEEIVPYTYEGPIEYKRLYVPRRTTLKLNRVYKLV